MIRKQYAHRNILLPTTSEEKAIRKSWGGRWGAFANIESKEGYVLVLLGVVSGKIVYCSDAPGGLSEDYIGFVKYKDRSMLTVTAHKITREDLLRRCWYYMPDHDDAVHKMILSGMQVYNALT